MVGNGARANLPTICAEIMRRCPPYGVRISRIQSGDDRHAVGAQRRKQSTDQADDQGQQYALDHQRRAELEVEHHLREVAAECRGGKAVEDQVGGNRADGAADGGEHQDSTSVPTKAGKPPKPMARKVAISTARAATEEYIVLSAPARAPNAMAIASGQPSFWMRSDVCDAWSAK